ncbi:uncharacterized protein LOC9648367 [Selaginella moellendorffii]|uniref:uncharacterized protein LOC9648367 n=1 Tax=Selaginella moellendorffii TaxID=88036 RepID=UPI000D1CF7E7|nr:uncharacterized protein LOC9648367 [Selaginella moellendorffii]|eukprot:XP_024523564.1 uncharacterized protein LOC9648367 [Selaginella moellendorffii]
MCQGHVKDVSKLAKGNMLLALLVNNQSRLNLIPTYMYNPAVALRDTMIELEVAIEGGKDSLSMAAQAGGETVKVNDALIAAVKKLNGGDPRQDDTSIRPMISESSAATVEKSVNEAVKAGTKLLVGGKQRGAFMEPMILEDAPFDTDTRKEEIFSPVILLYSYNDFKEAVMEANSTHYGLQAGIFMLEEFASTIRQACALIASHTVGSKTLESNERVSST